MKDAGMASFPLVPAGGARARSSVVRRRRDWTRFVERARLARLARCPSMAFSTTTTTTTTEARRGDGDDDGDDAKDDALDATTTEDEEDDDRIVMPGDDRRRRPTTTKTSTPKTKTTRVDVDVDGDSDDDELGRIESALAGHDGTWHLRANRVGRGTRRAVYAVVFAPGVPVRAQAHVDSAVVRYVRAGERVVGTSVTSDGWLELLGRDDAGGNVEGSAGWMLTRHPEHGALLERAGGRELPMTTMRLASAEATCACDHTALPFLRHDASYRVAHAPFVPVRARATMGGHVVGHRAEGDVVRASGRRGDWIALLDEETASETTREKEAREGGATRRWMLTLHPEFGRLLRRCHHDGSDIIL